MSNEQEKTNSSRRVRIAIGLLIGVPLVAACHQVATSNPKDAAVRTRAVAGVREVAADLALDPFEAAARKDPLGAIEIALREYTEQVTDYTCTFIKQEKIKGWLRKPQTIRVKFRDQPLSILMEWVENANKCDRVLYVKGELPNTRKGIEQAWVDPHGWAIDAILGKRGGVKQPIHSAMAKAASRRSIDQFGFSSTLRLVLKYAKLAKSRNELQFAFKGPSELEGRPTYLFERILPYTGEDGEYPERTLLVHLDRDNHMPIGVFAYADDAREDLLGSYVFQGVRFNTGLSHEDFNKKTLGF